MSRSLPPSPEPRDPALEAQMIVDPLGTAPVYGDWLQQRGHPRGALIATQLAGLSDEDLLAAHEDVLLGPLGPLSRPDPEDNSDHPAVELAWEAGFIVKARIIGGSYATAPYQILREVLRHPSTRFLRELVIGCVKAGDQDNVALTAVLLGEGHLPPLRSLYLADFDDSDYDGIDLSRAPIGDLRGLGVLYPRLERVILKGRGDCELDALPNAKQFAFRTSTMTKATLATIINTPWPQLEELELWFGDADRDYGAECTAADVRPLFERPLPKLATLRLMNNSFTDELVPMVVAWPGAAQLRVLDFGLAALTDAGAAELAKHRARFPKLERLGLFECSLLAATLGEFPVDNSPISGAQAIGSPRQKRGMRFSSVNE